MVNLEIYFLDCYWIPRLLGMMRLAYKIRAVCFSLIVMIPATIY